MKISIVVPCRNEKRYIEAFLASLMRQQLDPGQEIEILIADGMSDDGTRELLMAAAQRFPLRMIDNPGRIVSTGLNAAIVEADGEIVIRMDAHTVYAPDYVQQCVRVLQETGADSVGGPWVARGTGAIGNAIAAAFHSPFCTGGAKAHRADYEGEVDTVYLGCWPRSVFSKVGLFDPTLVRNQDDEFHFRLKRSGGRIWQSPRIQSSYVPRNSVRALFRQYLQYGYWKVAVARKHRGVAAWRHLIPGLFVASVMAAVAAQVILLLLGFPRAAGFVAIAFATELLIYLLASFVATLQLRKSSPLPVLLLLPAVTAVYHVSYGLGFLMGMGASLKTQKADDSNMFTALTR